MIKTTKAVFKDSHVSTFSRGVVTNLEHCVRSDDKRRNIGAEHQ